MPLPHEPIAIHGGCNCGAVRYRINVPSFEQRPLHFVHAPEEASDPTTPRLPLICICHCPDCRSATGSILPTWCLTPQEMFSISCLPKKEVDETAMQSLRLAPHDVTGDSKRPPYMPAHGILSGVESTSGTWLRVFCSTNEKVQGWDVDKRIYRSFCGRCGTNIAYLINPMPFKFRDMIDVVVGTVDRADMEQPWMQPERQLWHNYGVPWIKDVVKDMAGPIHPSFSTAEFIRK
ncbi:hypothetical protein A0O28_0075330 [Trichoderma guizhouense]|uniref:CENP-V/GFA domain-containing protein n=1 Tax=Trichoderma guizhouense TaxID=1491466 RepID=A0A1T3CW70_9HYPO|nr:hypothetical protein A0O28_0075330 [Trichoderma guizhouense]